jgi:hypothetical protein
MNSKQIIKKIDATKPAFAAAIRKIYKAQTKLRSEQSLIEFQTGAIFEKRTRLFNSRAFDPLTDSVIPINVPKASKPRLVVVRTLRGASNVIADVSLNKGGFTVKRPKGRELKVELSHDAQGQINTLLHRAGVLFEKMEQLSALENFCNEFPKAAAALVEAVLKAKELASSFWNITAVDNEVNKIKTGLVGKVIRLRALFNELVQSIV